MKLDVDSFLPLSPAILHILVALVGEDRHGYGIMQAVSRQSDGRYKLGPGTLYDNLQKLLSAGLVQEVPRATTDDDPRRRYYRISGLPPDSKFRTSAAAACASSQISPA